MEGRQDPRAAAPAPAGSYHERRRAVALEQQRAARQEAADRARRAALDALAGDAPMPAAPAPPPPPGAAPSPAAAAAAAREREARRRWAGLLSAPEWLVEPPADLAACWLAAPRPEGRRCLLAAARGRTEARADDGTLLEAFASALPGGGAGGGGARRGDECLLDCVRHEGSGGGDDVTYVALDALVWRGRDLCGCTAEFRAFWLRARLAELEGGGGRAVAAAPLHAATPAGLRAARAGDGAPYARDGLLLVHRRAHYAAGPTPLALRWRDAGCSRHAVAAGAGPQRAVLQLQRDGAVATGDDPPVALGRLEAAAAAAALGAGSPGGGSHEGSPMDGTQQQHRRSPGRGGGARPGVLLRFRLGPGGVRLGAGGAPAGADLAALEGLASRRRARADLLSKILFQQLAAAGDAAVGFDALLGASAAGEAAGVGVEELLEVASLGVDGGEG